MVAIETVKNRARITTEYRKEFDKWLEFCRRKGIKYCASIVRGRPNVYTVIIFNASRNIVEIILLNNEMENKHEHI